MKRSPWARIGVLAGIWGCSFLFIKVALEGMSATQVVLGRIVLGAVAILGWLAVRREPLPRDRMVWVHAAVMGLVSNVLPFLGFAWGEDNGATSGLAGIYNATTPLWTLVFAILFLPSERPNRARIVGLVAGFAGTLVVLAPWRSLHGAGLSGQLACLGAGACYGVAFVYTRRFLSGRAAPLGLAAAQLTCAAIEIGVVAPFVATHHVSLPPRVWLSVLALGAAGTGLAYVIYYGLVRDVGATTASTVTYLVPLVAVTLGVAAIGESLRWNDFVGALIVLVGILIAEGRLRRRRFVGEARGSSEAPG
ncbi:MAG: DMT family transporter [Frankiaceae bacterium]|nr:DMT family transporter [Frankiaceae bacterium]